MEDLPSNSHKSRTQKHTDERQPHDKIVEGKVIRKKKSLGRRTKELFFGGDDARSVWNLVAMEVLVPAAKQAVSDAVVQGLERSLYGEVRSRSSYGSSRVGGGHQSYNKMYDDPRQERRPSRRRPHDFNDIILASRVEATEVIDRLFDLVNKYDQATVADLYELLGETASYTDERWGWDDMRGSDIRRVRDGWLLVLPSPIPLT